MVARVKAVLRRYHEIPKAETSSEDRGKCVEYAGITINLTNYSVIVDGKNVEMPRKELELLYFLASLIKYLQGNNSLIGYGDTNISETLVQ